MVLLWGFTAAAQITNNSPAPAEKSVRTQVLPSLHEKLVQAKPAAPNQVKVGKVSLSGIAVEVVKTRNPLQLINPAAGPDYSVEDNLVRDPITQRPHGLKIFSIRF